MRLDPTTSAHKYYMLYKYTGSFYNVAVVVYFDRVYRSETEREVEARDSENNLKGTYYTKRNRKTEAVGDRER